MSRVVLDEIVVEYKELCRNCKECCTAAALENQSGGTIAYKKANFIHTSIVGRCV